jgi:cyclin-dependent kinase 7
MYPIMNPTMNPKAKPLSLLNANKPPIMSASTVPGEGGTDLAEQMNDDVRRQYVQGTFPSPPFP